METTHYSADPATIPGARKADVEQVHRWRREGRTLIPHAGRTALHYPGSLKLAEEEAKAYNIKGALRLLFIAERYEGWLPSESGAVGEGGLVSATSFGLLKGETTHGTGTPQKGGGDLHIGTTPGSATEAEGAAEHPLGVLGSIGKEIVKLINLYGLRLGEILAGAALILFGLATLAKGGQAPSLPGPL
jgi:hypothetical protein